MTETACSIEHALPRCGLSRRARDLIRTHREVSAKIVEQHEVRIEPNHFGCQCPPPVARHRHVPEAAGYVKCEPADSSNTAIAEPVHIDRIKVQLTSDEHDPSVRDRPQKRPNALEHQFL